jgi:hypothetical protein
MIVQAFALTSTDPTTNRPEMHETVGTVGRLHLVAISHITMTSLTSNRHFLFSF